MKYVARLMGMGGKPIQTFHPSHEAAKKWATMIMKDNTVDEGAYVDIYRVVEAHIEQVRR